MALVCRRGSRDGEENMQNCRTSCTCSPVSSSASRRAASSADSPTRTKPPTIANPRPSPRTMKTMPPGSLPSGSTSMRMSLARFGVQRQYWLVPHRHEPSAVGST
eukprot:3090117-Prymnesium_polylepis.2